MKHHYIILVSYYDTDAGRKFNRNYSFYGTHGQVEERIKKQFKGYTAIGSIKDVKIDLLRADRLTFIKTYKEAS